eukprot:COSAG02_NODE_4386_length_5421_cov_4.810973_5_plen_37_part_00
MRWLFVVHSCSQRMFVQAEGTPIVHILVLRASLVAE